MKKVKQSDPLIRLYWKTDREKINNILQRIPDKYLLGLLRRARNYYGVGWKAEYMNHEEILNYRNSVAVECKYDGCVFFASGRTYKKEAKRRGLCSA